MAAITVGNHRLSLVSNNKNTTSCSLIRLSSFSTVSRAVFSSISKMKFYNHSFGNQLWNVEMNNQNKIYIKVEIRLLTWVIRAGLHFLEMRLPGFQITKSYDNVFCIIYISPFRPIAWPGIGIDKLCHDECWIKKIKWTSSLDMRALCMDVITFWCSASPSIKACLQLMYVFALIQLIIHLL